MDHKQKREQDSQPTQKDRYGAHKKQDSQPTQKDRYGAHKKQDSQPTQKDRYGAQAEHVNTVSKKRNNKSHKNKKSYSAPPTWDFDIEFKGKELKDTKAELMEVLAAIDPDEILITPLVQKNKNVKFPVLKKDVDPSKDDDFSIEEDRSSSDITIDISQTCPICGRVIREIMYALHDYDHDQLAHFDCVFKKVRESVSEKLIDKHTLVYLGSGSFGIMEKQKNDKLILVEKIYPGAPVEELLHGNEAIMDDEI